MSSHPNIRLEPSQQEPGTQKEQDDQEENRVGDRLRELEKLVHDTREKMIEGFGDIKVMISNRTLTTIVVLLAGVTLATAVLGLVLTIVLK